MKVTHAGTSLVHYVLFLNLLYEYRPGGQAAQALDVQEAPQQDVQGQVQEEEERPGTGLWRPVRGQHRQRQTGGKHRQHTLHCQTENRILW